MKNSVNFSQFVDGFSTRKDNFSYAGLKALFEYFEQLEDDCDIDIEFDPIAICCEFSEGTPDYFESCYLIAEDVFFEGDQSETNQQTIDWLQDRTQVIIVDANTIIIQDF